MEVPRAVRRVGPGTVRRLVRRALRSMPRGGMLPDAVWEGRHRAVRILLVAHAVGVALFARVVHASAADSALCLIPLAVAGIAGLPGVSRQIRSSLGAVGLMTTSAIIVLLSHGAIEAHFHFFVMVPIVALYEDWLPFTLAIAFVGLHHGVMGQLHPQETFDHTTAWHSPWKWALVHATFLGGACAASIVNWRLHEQSRLAERELTEEMARQADTDPLTGLPNRKVLAREGSRLLVRQRTDHSSVAVLLIDLDRFKEINDTLGHSVGDRLLRSVAKRLGTSLRDTDTLVRLGGDEFAVILPDADLDVADEVAQRLLSSLSRPFAVEDLVLTVEASLGVAVSGDAYCVTDFDVLMRQADVAMYTAKGSGGGCAHYEQRLDSNDRSRLTLLADLRRALTGDEITIHYQPKIDLATGTLSGVEALIRWQHPQHGLLPPGDFLPLAETTTLMHPITLRVLDVALAQVARWQRDGHRVPVAVNLAARSIREEWLVPAVRESLERHRVDPALLRLEITETTLIVDPDAALRSLAALRDMGVRLSIDDFGTGYSSMSYLRRLPVDEIKVDRSFVSEMLQRRDDEVLVKTVVDLGHNLGMSVVAEGVEDAATVDALAAMGCDVAQGFHFGRPVPAAGLDQLLNLPAQRRAVEDGLVAESGSGPVPRSAPGSPTGQAV